MNGSPTLWPKLMLAAAAVVLIAGLAQLFRARFASGDVYPPYSSLRGDPLGTRVYHEALARTGVAVSRNFRDVARAELGPATIYLPGLDWSQLLLNDTDDAKALLASVRAGSRLVLGFAPSGGEQAALPTHGQARPDHREDASAGKDGPAAVSLARELGVDARWLPSGRENRHEAVRVAEGVLPERFTWHTALSFEPDGAAWRRVYSVDRYTAIIERDYGEGTVVLVGDAFVLSNEAMARARQPALLAWLQGNHRAAVFDETHLGVEENSGIAALARRYGLGHAALALVVVGLLYVWKNGSSLVPRPVPRGEDGEALAGRDASSGLVNLLGRTLPAGSLYIACLSEYRRAAPWRRLPPDARRALEALAVSGAADGRSALEAIRVAHDQVKRRT